MTADRLLTPPEVAAILGCTPRALRARIYNADDLPPFVMLGRHRRWRASDVDAWLAGLQSRTA